MVSAHQAPRNGPFQASILRDSPSPPITALTTQVNRCNNFYNNNASYSNIPPNDVLNTNSDAYTNHHDHTPLINSSTSPPYDQIINRRPSPIVRRKRRRLHLQPESVDKLSVVCFPLAFTLFN
ncbi:unnamed protein product, partial [Anisakis simplex]|uniref:Uncharacterized protein n=1 Tax=Anisakis simplex TaxID=6269 RepID=A0A0M3J8B6_ANISI